MSGDGPVEFIEIFKHIPAESFPFMVQFSSDWLEWKPHGNGKSFVSPASETISGYPPQTFIQNPNLFQDIIHPEDRQAFLTQCQNSSHNEAIHQQQVRIITRDGRVKWIRHVCRPVKNAQGNVLGHLSINSEVNDIPEEAFHTGCMTQLFRKGPVIVFKLKNAPNFPVEFVSPNIKHILGYSPEDLVSGRRSFEALLHPADREKVLKGITNSTVLSNKSNHRPVRLFHANGTERWIILFFIPSENGSTEFYYGYGVDITARKQQELQYKQNLRRIKALTRVLEKINRSKSLQEIYRTAVDGIVSVLKADRASILIFGPDNRVHFKSWKRLSAAYRRAVEGHFPWEPDDIHAEPFWYEDVQQAAIEPRLRKQIVEEGIASMAFIPLKGNERLLGKFMVYYNTPHHYSPEELHLIRILAENLSSAITRLMSMEQLRQSEAKYRSIFNHVLEGIYQSTADGRFITVNPAMVELFGYDSVEEMLAIPHTSTLYWDAEERKRLSAIAQEKGVLRNVEVKMKRRDGTPIWVLMNDRAVYDDNGNFLYYEGTLVDITDRKLTEKALKESEETYRLLIKGAPFPTAIYIDQMVYYCNAATLQLVEAERYEEIIGKNIFELVHPDSLETIRKQYEAFYYKGEKLPPTEAKLLTLKGNTRHVFVHSVKTRFDGKIGVLVQMIDITEWKRSQKALQESEERFRLAFRTSPDAISITRLSDGLIIDVNDGFSQITGFSREDVLGKTPEELNIWLSKEDRNFFIETLEKNGEFSNKEVRFRLKDGRVVHALLSAKIFQLNGVPHVLSIAKDIEPLKQAQKALEESEERLRVLINSTPDIICFKDGEGRWQEANEADLKTFELQHVDYRGKKDSELAPFSPFYKDAFLTCEATDEIAWKQKSMSRGIEIIPRPDGSQKYYDVIKVPIFNPDGSRKGLVVFGRDITEQKMAEQSLQRQLHFMKALNEMARSVIIHNDPERFFEHLIQQVGEALALDSCLLYAVDMNQKIATSSYFWRNPKLTDAPPPPAVCSLDGRPIVFNHIINGHPIESTPSKPHPIITQENLVQRLHHQFGIKSLFWYPLGRYQSRAFVLMCHHFSREHTWESTELNFIKAIAQLMEIAFMKMQFIEQIRQNANEIKQLALLVEQAKEIFAVTDLEGHIEYVNRAFEEITGYKASEVMGKTFRVLRSPKEPEETFKHMWDTLLKGKEWRGRIVNRRKNGELFVEDAVIFPIKNEQNQIIKFCKIGRDISREVQLEERLRQSQKMEAIGTLAGGIAHDFNNILTPLLGYTELALLSTPPESALHTQLEQIYKAGQRAKDLIKQILAFSRQSTLERRAIEITPIVKEVLKLLRATIPSTIEIVADIHKINIHVNADPVEIHQVLMNLCTNAYQAMPHGGRLTIRLEQITISKDDEARYYHLRPGKYVKISVIDTGVGIPPEIQEKIFEPYFTTKSQEKGTGLGLATVHGIVTSMGGTITVYSEPGKGAEFNVYLPAISNAASTPQKQPHQLPTGTETILFVDDEPAITELGKNILERLGYRVITFMSPTEALEAFRKTPSAFDLIITDMTMPGMTGAQLAESVRKINPHIPIILTTGYSEKITATQSNEMGIDHFISKPFSPKELALLIRQLLNKRQAQ